MHRLLASFSHAAEDPAPALPNDTVGGRQSTYIVVANASGAAVGITPVAGAALGPFQGPSGQTWIFGPVLGEDLPNHGIFKAVAGVVDISYVAARPRIDVRPAHGSINDDAFQ